MQLCQSSGATRGGLLNGTLYLQKFLTFDPDRAFDPNGRGIAMARMMSFAALEYQGRGNVVVAQVNLA